jgi:hypothetical protein
VSVRIVALGRQGEYLDERVVDCIDGEFRAEDIAVADYYFATTQFPEFTIGTAAGAKEGSSVPVDFGVLRALGASCEVSGRVAAAIADRVLVALDYAGPRLTPVAWPPEVERECSMGVGGHAVLSSEGEFSLRVPGLGAYTLRVSSPGRPKYVREVEVRSAVDLGVIELTETPVCTVNLLDAEGRAVSDARLSTYDRVLGTVEFERGEPGQYLAYGVGSQGFILDVRILSGHGVLKEWCVAVAAGDSLIKVRFPGVQDIAGRLSGREAPTGGTLRLSARRDGSLVGQTNAVVGHWVIRNVGEQPLDIDVEYLDASGQAKSARVVRGVLPGQHDVQIQELSR